MNDNKTEIVSASYITAETDHMAYQPGMDDIGSEIQDGVIAVSYTHLDKSDRRVVNVTLTDKGRAAYEYHRAFHDRMIASVMDTLSPEQAAILAQSLEKLQDFFRQEEAAMEMCIRDRL